MLTLIVQNNVVACPTIHHECIWLIGRDRVTHAADVILSGNLRSPDCRRILLHLAQTRNANGVIGSTISLAQGEIFPLAQIGGNLPLSLLRSGRSGIKFF